MLNIRTVIVNNKINLSKHCIGVRVNRQSCDFKLQICGESTIGGILTDFVINNESFCLGGVFGNRTENGSIFYNEVRGGIDCNFRAFRKSNAFAVIFNGEGDRPGITGLDKSLRRADKRQAKDNGRSKNGFFNNNFCAKNSAAEDFSFGSARRGRAIGAEEIISWCQKNMPTTAFNMSHRY